MLAGTQFGGYASQVVVPAADVVPLPDALSFEQGAAIPVNYGTAWAGLIGYGSLQPGERVLIHSAGGGVGIAATQIAKRDGAEVYGTASPGKHARCRELGVDHALDYTTPGWERGLPQFDVILDAIGGKSFRTQLRAAARRRAPGRLRRLRGHLRRAAQPASPRCAPSLRMPRFNMIKQMRESKAVIGLNMLSCGRTAARSQPWIGRCRRCSTTARSSRSIAGDVQLRGGRRGADDDHRAAQRRQGRAHALSPLGGIAARGANLPPQMSFQFSLLSLLLLPPRGE